MKRVCIFSAQYLPHLGGVENYTYNLSKKLILRGYYVCVVTSNPGELETHETVDGIEIYRFPVFNLIDGRYPVIKRNHLYKKMIQELRGENFSFVIVNTRFYIHSLIGVKLAKHLNVASMVIEHGTSHLSVQNKILDVIGGLYEHALTRMVKHYCKHYYAVSSGAAKWLEHFKIQCDGILPNSIDEIKIKEIIDNPVCSFKNILSLSTNDLVVTFTGRLLKEKGIYALSQAFVKLRRNFTNVHLLIAGEGMLGLQIEGLHCDGIHLLGRISFEEVISLLKETDVFCLPSDSEGFSTSILEAATCGTYIVSTNTGSIEDIIVEKEYGTILKDNSIEEIYVKLVEILKDNKMREIAGQKVQTHVCSTFTWEKCADNVIIEMNKIA